MSNDTGDVDCYNPVGTTVPLSGPHKYGYAFVAAICTNGGIYGNIYNQNLTSVLSSSMNRSIKIGTFDAEDVSGLFLNINVMIATVDGKTENIIVISGTETNFDNYSVIQNVYFKLSDYVDFNLTDIEEDIDVATSTTTTTVDTNTNTNTSTGTITTTGESILSLTVKTCLITSVFNATQLKKSAADYGMTYLDEAKVDMDDTIGYVQNEDGNYSLYIDRIEESDTIVIDHELPIDYNDNNTLVNQMYVYIVAETRSINGQLYFNLVDGFENDDFWNRLEESLTNVWNDSSLIGLYRFM